MHFMLLKWNFKKQLFIQVTGTSEEEMIRARKISGKGQVFVKITEKFLFKKNTQNNCSRHIFSENFWLFFPKKSLKDHSSLKTLPIWKSFARMRNSSTGMLLTSTIRAGVSHTYPLWKVFKTPILVQDPCKKMWLLRVHGIAHTWF